MKPSTDFILNGEPVSLSVRPDTTVLDIVRNHLGLKGTKEGCAEGDCGACTVLIARDGVNSGRTMAANSCIMTAAQIADARITTVEGIGNPKNLSDIQTAMAENGSSQCGFCTPGIVMALSGLAHNNPSPTEAEIHDALAGNLCRCTGYKPIVQAALKALSIQSDKALTDAESPAVQETSRHGGSTVYRPQTLDALIDLRSKHAEAVVLAGGTDLGVARAAYETDWDEIILTSGVAELRRIAVSDDHWTFGAAVTWAEVLDLVADELPSFATLIRRFGSTQIRSMGTIGGNIGTASPIGDGPPAMIALGAEITLANSQGNLEVIKLEDFFLDYRKTALPEHGVIVSIKLPRPAKDEVFRVYKISKRYDQDISTVCGAFWLKFEDGVIVDIRAAYGGMAATPKRAINLEARLRGEALDDATIERAMKAVSEDFAPLSDWRGSSGYRDRVAASLIKRLQADLEGQTVEVALL